MSLEVKKVIPVTLDLGNLAVFDINPVEETPLQTDKEAYLSALTRDNMQLLTNALFQLPTSPSDVGAIATLPKPTTALPRALPIPKPKPLTRWEAFARSKGIDSKKKHSSHAYDEQRGEWRPRHGAKSAKNDAMADWIQELKPGQEIPQD